MTVTGQYSGFLLAFAATAMFSTKSIFIKWAYQYGVDTTTLLTWRMIFSAPIYAVILLLLWRQQPIAKQDKSSLLPVIALGILGYYGASWLDLAGLNYITAHFERLVLYTYPIFVLIINAVLNKRPFNRAEVIALSVVYTGLFGIFGFDLQRLGQEVLWGSLLVLASAICFAGYVVGSQQYSRRIGSKYFTCIGMLAASAAICLHFLIYHDLAQLNQPVEVLWIALAIAIVATVLPSFLMNAAIARIGGNKTAILGSSAPVITTLFAVGFLGEVFTWVHALGMFLVLLGISLLSKAKAT
ncbi:EamA family transporter [Saccharobesus litoralis]|uniref:EamA family transporter n=1 Tax=Saccharobesus litoralis TaxID=2172099 RepID=A0A2S0VRH6_9ALTE|nr:DMT family transporter [Saccharobesus litoralis]AWB66825.1 EamA family transporter [Saccharobesus litoralis]